MDSEVQVSNRKIKKGDRMDSISYNTVKQNKKLEEFIPAEEQEE